MRVGFGTSVRVLCLLIGAGSSVPPATAQAPRAATMVSRADAYLKASVRHDQFSGRADHTDEFVDDALPWW